MIAAVWFGGSFAAILWVWGLNPVTTISRDEALNRFSASLIVKQGRPFLALPFGDPENLAHPHFWLSLGEKAIPAYAPLAYYFYALLLRLGALGLLLVAALPASAAAAFAAGTAKLLPLGRRWLSVLAPALGFPALYWLLRPWANLSALLICLSWAFWGWASWYRTGNDRHLAMAVLGVAAGAAVRPDYAAYLTLSVLLFTVAARPSWWKRVLFLFVLFGSFAVLANLVLNGMTTGNPSLSAYQMFVARAEGGSAPRGLGLLRQLLIPMGIPTIRMVGHFLNKYWVTMGLLGVLLAGQLTLVPMLRARPPVSRMGYLGGLAVLVCLMASHVSGHVFGVADPTAMVNHSIPRYWAPVYLFAALPPILFLGHCRNRKVLVIGVAMTCVLAIDGVYEVFLHQPSSLSYLHDVSCNDGRLILALARRIPRGAMIYSSILDSVLWPRWRVGMLDEPEPTAASMSHAIEAHLPVFVVDPRFGRHRADRLGRALRSRHLVLIAVDSPHGIYRIEAGPLGSAGRTPCTSSGPGLCLSRVFRDGFDATGDTSRWSDTSP